MYVPHEHAEHPYHRVLSVTGPGRLTGAEIKGPPRRVGATHGSYENEPIPGLVKSDFIEVQGELPGWACH